MDQERRESLDKRIAALAAGEGGYDGVVDELRSAEVDYIIGLAGHVSGIVRSAMVEGARGRTEPEILEAVACLASDDSDEVRAALSRAISQATDWPLPDTVFEKLLDDHQPEVREKVARAARNRPALVARLCEALRTDSEWEVRLAAGQALKDATPTIALPALVKTIADDEDQDVARTCALMAEGHAVTLGEAANELELGSLEDLRATRSRVRRLGKRRFPQLYALLDQRAGQDVDPSRLSEFGTDLTAEAEDGRLPHAYYVDHAVAALLKVLLGSGSCSAVLFGESGVGKTAIVHELVHQLACHTDGPWRVLRVSPSDMLSGTKYIGEWQTKIHNLIEAACSPKRVLLYVPNLEELSDAGRASNSAMSIASMLAPVIEDGRIAVVGETTPKAWARGLGCDPSLNSLFTRVEVAPMPREATREILELVAAEAEVDVPAPVLDHMLELADLYLTESELPGRAVGLLRRMFVTRGATDFEARDVLQALHESTGIPTDFLDDSVPLQLEAVREFFERRVMGQPEAIDRVLDLVTLVKAGLTDPEKPSGVLLFVGPTGVGKTELARSLAELLFGDPGRLLRLDMSEFATYEAFERLIGRGSQPGLLTDAVRDHPFSVLLLDEIEKAHSNVFDLCLQIFDAGRLTDASGRTANFQSTIIVLTSNLGSKIQTEPSVGFDGGMAPPPDRQAMERALGMFFRPEFLGRIDHVVHFQPLSAETADRIARREVARVLQRSGIERRRLSVEVEPPVYALLLREGYSPALGARPLKRTVESLILMPIARALAEGAIPQGSHLRLVERHSAVEVETIDPDHGGEEATERENADLATVRGRVERLRQRAASMEARRSELIERCNAPDFWHDRAAARLTMDAVHRLDRLLDDLRRLEWNLEITAGNPNKRKAARFLESHEHEAGRLEFLFAGDDLSDAFVTITAAQIQVGGLDGVERLARMYRAYARRLRFECEVLDDRLGGEPPEDTITLAIDGAGAYALLAPESGLHQLTLKQPGRARPDAREMVRVDVLAAPSDEQNFPQNEVRVDVRELRGTTGRIAASPAREILVLHLPSMTSVCAWTARGRDEAHGALQALLRARLTAVRDRSPETVRRYVFGAAPLVRDRLTGLTTGRLDRILGGELELVSGRNRRFSSEI